MEDRNSLYVSAIRPSLIAAILYVIVKHGCYLFFFDEKYILPRGVSSIATLLFTFVFTRQSLFSRRQMSCLVPVSMIAVELVTIPFVDYDRLIYFLMIGSTLISLLYIDYIGALATIVVSWVSVSIYIFVFNYSLMGEKSPYEDDIFYFMGIIVLQTVIFLMGKYSIGALERSRRGLEVARKLSEEYSKMKSDLFSMVSHEMRTPLTVMSTFTQYAVEKIKAEGGVNEETLADLNAVSEESMRVADMVNSTFGIFKAIGGAGGMNDLKSAAVDIGTIAENLVRLLKPVAERKGRELTVDTKGCAGPVAGDESALTQLLWNILQNAIVHSGAKTMFLTVEAAEDAVLITLEDDGVGIPPKLLPRVFERGVSGSPEGSGVGLYLCREIVKGHGGRIEVVSGAGRAGTLVSVSLPRAGGAAS